MERDFSNLLRGAGKIGALIELGRPWNGIITGLFAVFGVYVAGGTLPPFNAVIIFLTFCIAYMAGATLNDIYDESIDKINMPYRPLEEGRVSKQSAWTYSMAMHMVALLLSALISIEMMVFTIVFFAFSAFYSMPPVYLSRRGFVAQLDLAFVAFLVPIYAGIVYATGAYSISTDMAAFMVSMYFLFVSIFLLKDFKDEKGDRKGNKRTPVVQYGMKTVRVLLMLSTIVSYIAMVYTFSLVQAINEFSLFLLSALFVMLLVAESQIIKGPEKYFGLGRIVLFAVILVLFMNIVT